MPTGDDIFHVFFSPLSSLASGGKEVTFTSQVPPLFVFLSVVLSFYGCSFVCGVVVSGGEGVQRKVVVVGKSCTFFLHVALGGVSWDVLPSVFKKDELLRRYQRHQG